MALTRIGNQAITLDAAEIPNLPASKITTGTLADARISASSVNQHSTTFDDNDLVNDLSALAIRQASDGDRAKYNTNNQYVDVFQDATGVTALTNCSRSSFEYVASVVEGAETEYDYNGASTKAEIKWNNMVNNNGTYYEIDNDGDSSYADSKYTIPSLAIPNRAYPTYSPGNASNSTYFIYDFKSSQTWTGKFRIGKQNTWGDVNQFKLEYSTDDSSYTAVNLSGATATTEHGPTHDGGTASGCVFSNGNSSGEGFLSKMNTSSISTSAVTITTGTSITARYFKLTIQSLHGSTANSNAGFGVFAPWHNPVTANATGSFTSNNITAPSSINKMGAIITYQDNAGTNTLNTDIILKLSANGGSNYTTATLVAMPDFATGIKMAKINDLTIGNAGTSLKYKIEFANQAQASKEARIRGVSLQY